jgi:hypothetical protein
MPGWRMMLASQAWRNGARQRQLRSIRAIGSAISGALIHTSQSNSAFELDRGRDKGH